jgi:ABC-2 type transport system ATP-binding protein
MEEVQAICDRISIMDSGRVIIEGTLDELVGNISHEDTVRLIAAMPSDALTEDIKAISGIKNVIANGENYIITSCVDSGNLNRIMEVTMRHGGVKSITEDKPNLEDVFLTLTGKKLRDEE